MTIQQKGKVGFFKAFIDYWKGYVDINGRTTRGGYWKAVLWQALIMTTLIVTTIAMFLSDFVAIYSMRWVVLVLLCVYGLASVVPTFTIAMRRFNDIGLSLPFSLVFTVIMYIPGISIIPLLLSLLNTNQFKGFSKRVPSFQSFVSATKDFWKGYVRFKGRTSRDDFFKVAAFIFVSKMILFFLIFFCTFSYRLYMLIILSLVYVIYYLALILPMVALGVRRMIDIGLSYGVALLLAILGVMPILYINYIAAPIVLILALFPKDHFKKGNVKKEEVVPNVD